MHFNKFIAVPVSALSGMTALNTVDLSFQFTRESGATTWTLQITSPLLPILHPGLITLDLRQTSEETARMPHQHSWDSVSLFHLGRAMLEVAEKRPVPTLLFK